MKPRRMSRPSSRRIGMFWRFGSLDDSRPVAATVWLNDVCSRPVCGFTSAGSASMYVLSSFDSSRYSMSSTGSSCPASASSCSTLASVDGPVAVFLRIGSFSRSNSTSRSCGLELMLNSPPAAA